MIVNENNFEVIDRASKRTLTDYGIKWFDAENISGYIENDSLISIIEDLLGEIEHLEEQIEDIENDIRDNYKPIPLSEQYGISDKDFI